MTSVQMREITHLIIHCADTYARMDIGVDEIRQWHKDRGWSDVGYHFVIRRDGTVDDGRNVAIPGAHAKGMNAHSIGICMVGGKADDGGPEDNFTDEQWNALAPVVNDLLELFPGADVMGHCDVPGAHKTCPNFNVREWAATLNPPAVA